MPNFHVRLYSLARVEMLVFHLDCCRLILPCGFDLSFSSALGSLVTEFGRTRDPSLPTFFAIPRSHMRLA